MELLIDKKYLLRLERYTKFGYGGTYDPWAVRYVFALPENAGLPIGYTVCIDAQRVEWERNSKGILFNDSKPLYTKELENDKTYRLSREESTYEATMTENRVKGKRYKRYKFSAEEIYALYQNVDLSSAELVVAKVDIYLEGRAGATHKVFYGNRIDKTKYLIGKVKGCWFYCSELDTKRRINSHGVTILGKISTDVQTRIKESIGQLETDIENCKCLSFNLKVHTREVMRKVLSDIEYLRNSQDEEVAKAISNIHCSLESALQVVEKKLAENAERQLQLIVTFEKQIKKYFIKENI